MKRITVSVVVLLLVGLFANNAFSWPVPDTGQTKCYDDEGNEIKPCPGPGELFYGQDGNYLINPPSYESLGGGTMVKDNVTGLIWEVKTDDGTVHDKDDSYSWYDIGNFINVLNSQTFGGYSDWRIPTPLELQTILSYNKWNPAIDEVYFPNCLLDYWSSATALPFVHLAYPVSFDTGSMYSLNKYFENSLRAARGVELSSSERFVINADGTVTDNQTGLMWQQRSSGSMNWQNALSYCESLVLAGYSDWRLPSAKELASILDFSRYSPAIDDSAFLGTFAEKYWSSSSIANQLGNAWCFDFDDGTFWHLEEKSTNQYVRAVRGGQRLSLEKLEILKPWQASKWNIDAPMPITWDPAGFSGNVAIFISRQGGRAGTFETIASSTSNDGYFQWTVTSPFTFNAMLKIEPVSDPTKGTVQGLFSIVNDVSIDPLHLKISEPSGEATFTIKLNKAPSDDVIIDLSTTNPGEFTLVDGSNNRANKLTVTLDGANWQTGVDVTVRAEADNTPDGNQISQVLTSTVNSDDPRFSGLNIANVSAMVEDNQTGVYVDSVYPTFGTFGEALDLTVRGLGFVDGTTQVFITPSGGSETEITSVTVDDDETLHVTIPGPASAVDYDLKVYNSPSETDVLPEAISFADSSTVTAQRAKKAIIVAGGGPFIDNDLWTATRRNANHAYAALFGQGYDADSIQYLSPAFNDVTGDGSNDVDDDASLSTLETAITDWSVNTSPAATDLMIYLIGPGRTGEFLLKSTEGYEVALSASTLDGWLDTVQSSLTGDLIVIIDSPQAGSFLAPLAAPGRIVISGSSAGERAWYLDDGEISFSWPFWDAVFNDGELLAAFDKADDLIGDVQTPSVDTDGNGTPDPRTRRTNLTEITVGRGRNVDTSPPSIGSVCSHTTLPAGDTDYELWAGSVDADNGISQVWARIFPPMQSYQPGDRPVLTLPTLRLRYDEVAEHYAELYKDFTENGTYKVLIHATDKREFQSIPKMVRVTQGGGDALLDGDLNADGTIGLADVMVALKAAAGMSVFNTAHIEPTGDERIGVEDALYLLQRVSGVR